MRLDKRVAERFGLVAAGGDDGGAARAGRCRRADLPRPGARGRAGDAAGLHARPAAPGNRPRGGCRCSTRIGDILIVDKPAGLLTQPTPDRERDTLAGTRRALPGTHARVEPARMSASCTGSTS